VAALPTQTLSSYKAQGNQEMREVYLMKLREKAQKKLKKQGGFTLIEMLIVVAIIAILVAVAIPIVSSSLNNTKKATDQANERSAKSLATIAYLDGNLTYGADGTVTKYLDVDAGTLVDTAPTATYGKCSDHSGAVISVTINKDGNVTVAWSNGGAVHGVTESSSASEG
jgi:type IV pilus assembly protein PilA